MSTYKDKLLEKIEDLELENQRLKELLKECKDIVEAGLENARMCESYTGTEYFKGLLNKRDNAIGESNE